MDGICTLGNDQVLDQIIALLNSIEVNWGQSKPVCIYPYDDNISKLTKELAKRPQVKLYNHQESIARWDSFAHTSWNTSSIARELWLKAGSKGYHRFGTHRRYCAFDAPFQRFLYMDADTLLLKSPEEIFAKLDNHDCVVYDYQYKDPSHVYNLSSSLLARVFPHERVAKEIFCSGFYGSKQGLFNQEKRDWLISQLQIESDVLYPMAPDQTLINYMMMRSSASIYNFALHLPFEEKTGCCVTSPHFQEQDNLVYDKGNLLTYLHYIGISSKVFSQICAGENIDFPYRETFLHYRYLHEREKQPKLPGKPQPYNQIPGLATRIINKLVKK